MTAQPQRVSLSGAATRAVRLGRPAYDVERRTDGSLLLRAREALQSYPARMTDKLVEWAQREPARTLFAAREADCTWRHISYGEALGQARAIGQALLKRNLSADRPLII